MREKERKREREREREREEANKSIVTGERRPETKHPRITKYHRIIGIRTYTRSGKNAVEREKKTGNGRLGTTVREKRGEKEEKNQSLLRRRRNEGEGEGERE